MASNELLVEKVEAADDKVKKVEAVGGFPPKKIILLFYMNTLGGLHRLHLFFSTFFLLSKIIIDNQYNNNINIIY